MERRFSVEEARAMVPEVLAVARELIPLRAELAAGAHDTGADGDVGLADLKALEARMSELIDHLTSQGIQVKGWAPLLLDFPAVVGGREVLLCWLEGERSLDWFHDPAHGFAGRRPLTELGE